MQLSRRLRRELTQVRVGLTLACVKDGVTSLPLDPDALADALDRAWRRWPHAYKFPALSRGTVNVGALVWDEVDRPRRRADSSDEVYWRADPDNDRLHLLRTRTQPPLDDALDATGPVSGHGWEGLAKTFLRSLESTDPEQQAGEGRSSAGCPGA